MKITAIKQQIKRPERVSVFVDGRYGFSLTLDQLLEQKLKKDLELDEARLKGLKKISDEGKLKARVLEWLLNRPRSERELRDYLIRKKTEVEQTDALVEWAKTSGRLDDAVFARWFAENRLRKQRSWRHISAELRGKGISPDTIQSIEAEIGSVVSIDEQNLRELVNKLRDRPRYSDEVRLKRYLLSKGFDYQLVKEIVSDLGS